MPATQQGDGAVVIGQTAVGRLPAGTTATSAEVPPWRETCSPVRVVGLVVDGQPIAAVGTGGRSCPLSVSVEAR